MTYNVLIFYEINVIPGEKARLEGIVFAPLSFAVDYDLLAVLLSKWKKHFASADAPNENA